MINLYAVVAEDGSDRLASGGAVSHCWLAAAGGLPPDSGFWFPGLRLWLHRLDHDRAAIDGLQQMAGGGDSFCLIIARRIALGSDQQNLASSMFRDDSQALDMTISGGV